MSLITDPLYIIHTSRIKFLRMDERGERIISFPPTVMSDDYVRLAAPIYPEMQYCYSPVYDGYLNNHNNIDSNNGRITSSPRTTKRNYRQRSKPQQHQNVYNKAFNNQAAAGSSRYPKNTTAAIIRNEGPKSSTTDSEDDDIEVDKQLLLSGSGKPIETTTMASLAIKDTEEEDEEEDEVNTTAEETTTEIASVTTPSIINPSSFHPTSLHPSVDSAIDPSPRSSIDEHGGNTTFSTFPPPPSSSATPSIQQQQGEQVPGAHINNSIDTTVDISSINDVEEEVDTPSSKQQEQQVSSPLEYTKKLILPAKFTKQKPNSALSALIAEKATTAENPFSDYSFVSGKGESKSITLCVYLPHSNAPFKPVSLVVRPDAITDDVIGYILYDYIEEKRQPELNEQEYDLAEWVLLIAEDDGEIEDDLPAIDRTRNIGRVSFEQFALCRATPSQAKQNDLDRVKMGRSKIDLETIKRKREEAAAASALPTNIVEESSASLENAEIAANLLIDNNYTSPNNNEENTISATFNNNNSKEQERDASNVAVPIPSSKATLTKATMPMTPLKYFRIKLMTSEEVSATTAIPVYAEMFIGDVLELVSRKRKLDPNEYMLTIADSKVIVPNDTTVESMKGITDLTLTKKNTQLSIPSTTTTTHLWRSPIKRKKDEVNQPMYFSTTTNTASTNTTTNTNDNGGILSQYKKYTVSRKMPMFVSKRVYILAIDGDYIHLMPPEHKGMFDSVKTTSFHASAVRSSKQSKKVPTNFKIIILKERDFKTYDLEAENPKEAGEICSRIRFLMQVTKGA